MALSSPSDLSQRPHSTRLLLFVVVSLFLANVGQWGICRVAGLGNPGGIKPYFLQFVHVRQWTDSWLPMLKSLDYFHAHPTEPIYYAHLYDTLIYPLASLLPLAALEKLGLTEPAILKILAISSWLAVFGVGAVSLWMGQRLLRRRNVSIDWKSIVAVMSACVF